MNNFLISLDLRFENHKNNSNFKGSFNDYKYSDKPLLNMYMSVY